MFRFKITETFKTETSFIIKHLFWEICFKCKHFKYTALFAVQ